MRDHQKKYLKNHNPCIFNATTTFDEDEIIPPECNLGDSDNEVDDNGFLYDTNVPVGLNADPTTKLEAICIEELGLDYGYCLSEKELFTDYSSSEENNYHFPIYDAEKEKYDPQLDVEDLQEIENQENAKRKGNNSK
ncbi:uncharacterized protein Fot_16694 [Forsythia ovata]|uniref:Uncharacterized protein n=1 Tax=Forsythia ovata TaxID=205694 RepID=A0ABD1VD85_9LAMI